MRAGSADLLADVHWVFKTHIVLGLTILLVFPFTRLVHMLSAGACFLVAPFTKLSHMALVPLTQLPAELAWRFPPDYPELVALPCYRWTHVVAVQPGHPLALEAAAGQALQFVDIVGRRLGRALEQA